jgi:dTMP kinase
VIHFLLSLAIVEIMALFISFEGIDGSGKSTQIRLLESYLCKQGVPVVVAREPGGTEVGKTIRQILLHSKNTRLKPMSELLLYYASRYQNLHENILPALMADRWVLCDRFADASMAYQGYGRGINLDFIRLLDQEVIQKRNPDLTMYIDIEPSVGLSRARERNQNSRQDEGRFENESIEFFSKVREGYLKLAKENPLRIKIIDGNQSIEAVHRDILRHLPI